MEIHESKMVTDVEKIGEEKYVVGDRQNHEFVHHSKLNSLKRLRICADGVIYKFGTSSVHPFVGGTNLQHDIGQMTSLTLRAIVTSHKIVHQSRPFDFIY